VLVDSVEGGASVSFMSPFSHQQALAFFRKVAAQVASGDTVLLAARLAAGLSARCNSDWIRPPNQPHRADIKKLLVHRSARGHGVGAALMAQVEEEARRRGRWLLGARYRAGRKRPIASICAKAGRRPVLFRTMRCFRWPALRHRHHVKRLNPSS